MANATPVSKKVKQAAPEMQVLETGPTPAEDLKARAEAILAEEVPHEIADNAVNQVGQLSSYGKAKQVLEIAYDVYDRKGNPTGEQRFHTRIDH